MSLQGVRAAFAAALSDVAGVTGYEYRPAVPAEGDAWPLLGQLARGPGLSFDATWRVLVALPADEEAASLWTDMHLEQLVDALDPVAFVTAVTPVALPTDVGDMLALQFTMDRE